MANPKRKHSKARTRQRRSKYYGGLKKQAPTLMECPECGETKMLHRACPSCGNYRGRQVIEPQELV